MVSAITAGARDAGRDPAEIDIAGCGWLSLAENRGQATDVLRQMVSYFGPYLEEPALATIGLGGEDFRTIGQLVEARRYKEAAALVTDEMTDLAIRGTPEDVIRRIESIADMGITQVNLGGPIGPDPAEAIRLMGEKVIPYFRPAGQQP